MKVTSEYLTNWLLGYRDTSAVKIELIAGK